jgi:hypothetical protein
MEDPDAALGTSDTADVNEDDAADEEDTDAEEATL